MAGGVGTAAFHGNMDIIIAMVRENPKLAASQVPRMEFICKKLSDDERARDMLAWLKEQSSSGEESS